MTTHIRLVLFCMDEINLGSAERERERGATPTAAHSRPSLPLANGCRTLLRSVSFDVQRQMMRLSMCVVADSASRRGRIQMMDMTAIDANNLRSFPSVNDLCL